MEAYVTEMSLEGKSFPLLKCQYRFYQRTNETGKPTDRPRSGLIELYCTGTDDEQLVDWAMNPQKKLNGQITFYRPGQGAKFKELNFEDAYCADYRENFRADGAENPGGQVYVFYLGITAARIQIGNVTHDNQWS